ncbi:MAG: restriction endonuclease subunit S [Chloroflexi bacterium]|nr:restriction endonuclease subunit S [Chloroflexota bacterium]
MSKLKEYKFNELYSMSSGISSKPEQAGHGFPFVSFSTVFNNYFLPETLPDLMDTSEQEQEKYSIKKGDVLLTRTSETIDELGMSCVALKDYPTATYSGFVKRLRPTKTDITYDKYMGFYLRSKFFRKTMTNNAFITLRASLNEAIFSYINLYLPDYQTQKRIGDFLHLLNTKIELNGRINAELESMAKTLYDYWFVQFDFPNEKGKPYKSAGGKMVWNEELKREIPPGWDVKELGNYAEPVRGVTYKKEDIKTSSNKNAVPILRATNITNGVIDLNDMVYVPKEVVSEEQFLNKFDVLITMSSGSKAHVGKNAFYYFDQRVSFGAFCSKLSVNKSMRFYVNTQMQSDSFKKYIANVGLGTNINNLTNKHITEYKLLIPPKELLLQYEKTVEDFYNKIGNNQKESQTLTELRDWLLPMLMNGQVVVK